MNWVTFKFRSLFLCGSLIHALFWLYVWSCTLNLGVRLEVLPFRATLDANNLCHGLPSPQILFFWWLTWVWVPQHLHQAVFKFSLIFTSVLNVHKESYNSPEAMRRSRCFLYFLLYFWVTISVIYCNSKPSALFLFYSSPHPHHWYGSLIFLLER